MKAGAHTHRDTLAFVLAIVGAMAWSTFPIGGLLFGPGEGNPTVAMLSIAIAGALIGAWSGASVWRHVSPVIAAFAGAISMAGLIASMALAEHERLVDAGVIEIVMMAVVAIAAYGGAVLGRRAEIPRVALTASWITLGVLAIAGAALAALEASGVRSADLAVAVVFLAPFPGALVAATFCHVRPGALAGRLLLLTIAAFVLLALTTFGFANEGETFGIFLGSSLFYGGLLAVYGALAAWIGHAVRRRLRYEPPLPPAQIVER